MIRLQLIAILLLAALNVNAQPIPAPEDCLGTGASSITVDHAGKTYRLTSEECRAGFLSDPERFSQLYDALLELRAAGETVEARKDSLVPS